MHSAASGRLGFILYFSSIHRPVSFIINRFFFHINRRNITLQACIEFLIFLIAPWLLYRDSAVGTATRYGLDGPINFK